MKKIVMIVALMLLAINAQAQYLDYPGSPYEGVQEQEGNGPIDKYKYMTW